MYLASRISDKTANEICIAWVNAYIAGISKKIPEEGLYEKLREIEEETARYEIDLLGKLYKGYIAGGD